MKKRRFIKRTSATILLYAASETDSNILYASNFNAPDPFLFFRTPNGKRYMVMSDLEIDRAKGISSAHHVLSLSHYTNRAKERLGKEPDIPDIALEALKDFRVKRVIVPDNFPVGLADALRKRKIKVVVKSNPFFPERLTKSADEVWEIKKSMRAAEAGMRVAVETLKKSRIKTGYLYYRGKRLTAEMLRMMINTTILALGYNPGHTIVAPGKHGCDPHDVGSGPIRPHESVVIDIFPRSLETGYWGDITRTFVRGKAPDNVVKLHKTVYDGQRLGLSMIRDGVKTKPIHRAILDLFEKRGYKTGKIKGRMQGFFHGTGHGLGLDIHEPPRIAINNQTLKKGMVVTVEPGLYYLADGGMRIEDTILVTKHGYENLTRFPKRLEIL